MYKGSQDSFAQERDLIARGCVNSVSDSDSGSGSDSDGNNNTNDPVAENQANTRFSFDRFLKEHGTEGVKDFTRFTLEEFDELHAIVHDSLYHLKRGTKEDMSREKLFIFLVWVTSAMTYTRISKHLKISLPTVHRYIDEVILHADGVLSSRFLPKTISEFTATRAFENRPDAVGAVDASVVRIVRPKNSADSRRPAPVLRRKAQVSFCEVSMPCVSERAVFALLWRFPRVNAR